MDEFVTTCVQQQIRVFESHGEFRSDIQRFMRLAKIKESHLVIFPELCGLLLAPPLVPGLKRTLLRVAERQVKRKPSLIDRMVGRLANSATDALGGIGGHIMEAFAERIDALRDAYLTIFSETAREYEMYVLAGSIYLPDTRDGQVHNTAYFFGPTGEVIGQQSKITLDFADTLFCKPATTGLEVFDTDFGKLGVLIGQDALFPESGRILNALGASAVVHLVAAPGYGAFSKLRGALTARVQENVLLGAQSCLVGKNIIVSPKNEKNDYIGKSAILAPAEMTTRYSGLLGEVGSMVTDGVISSVWDLKRLYELRSTIDIAVNEPLRNEVLRGQIQALYGFTPGAPVRPMPPDDHIAPPVEWPQAEPEAAVTAMEQTPETPTATLESKPAEQMPEPVVLHMEPGAEPTGADESEVGQAASGSTESAANIDELPALPLVYIEAEPEPVVAAPDDEAPPSPPESAAPLLDEPVQTAEQPDEAIAPMQLRMPELPEGEEPTWKDTDREEPAQASRDHIDEWPALEELASPAIEAGEAEPSSTNSALDIRLLVNPAAEMATENTPATPAEEFAHDPAALESAAPADTNPAADEKPESPQDKQPVKKRWPFSRR
jgi:predicted amidohydrolase